MKKFPSKADERQQLAREVADYLRAGGEIHEVPRGVSGRDTAATGAGRRQSTLFDRRAAEPRTDLTAVVAVLEARRQAMKAPQRTPRKRPRKIVVYDDFGEPVREVWRED